MYRISQFAGNGCWFAVELKMKEKEKLNKSCKKNCDCVCVDTNWDEGQVIKMKKEDYVTL